MEIRLFKILLPMLAALLVALLAMVLAFASPAWADTYSTNFENPPFTPGSPNGQDG